MSPSAAEWTLRYLAGQTPWDMGKPHPELVRRLEDDPTLGADAVGRALVPGCGRGHDAIALARAGWQVTAVDLVGALETRTRAALDAVGASFVVGDVFQITDRFDLVFDHTFYCALDPSDRHLFGRMSDAVLDREGMVASLVFPIGRAPADGGPPHGMEVDDLSSSLGAGFELTEAGEPFCTGGRRWPHVWATWRKV